MATGRRGFSLYSPTTFGQLLDLLYLLTLFHTHSKDLWEQLSACTSISLSYYLLY